MKVVLVVTGGVTGIPGKWEIDFASDATKASMKNEEQEQLARLLAEARTAGVFQKEFLGDSPDSQTYELLVDSEHVKWTEPSNERMPPVPPVLKQIKQIVVRNARRQPYLPP